MEKAIIIDDDAVFTKALEHKLIYTYNFDVQSFNSAEKSLNNISGKPDIIFLDYHLSSRANVMDGLVALGVLKKQYPNATFVMMSGEENTHWLKQGQKHGANAYLTKTAEKLIDLEAVVTDHRLKNKK